VGKGKRADIYLEVRKRRGHITRIFSERRFIYFSVIETDTATSSPD
jgi:hypothetical protein